MTLRRVFEEEVIIPDIRRRKARIRKRTRTSENPRIQRYGLLFFLIFIWYLLKLHIPWCRSNLFLLFQGSVDNEQNMLNDETAEQVYVFLLFCICRFSFIYCKALFPSQVVDAGNFLYSNIIVHFHACFLAVLWRLLLIVLI